MTFENGAYYWAVETQAPIAKYHAQFIRTEEDRTVVVQASDMSALDPEKIEFWFYECGSDEYYVEDDFERFICKVERPSG